jgi:hypothetical protein
MIFVTSVTFPEAEETFGRLQKAFALMMELAGG